MSGRVSRGRETQESRRESRPEDGSSQWRGTRASSATRSSDRIELLEMLRRHKLRSMQTQ
ncbi:unnamed protein product, partial [Amoebophrya sp. A25]|eukprot:GSA25T00008553001.1